MKRYLLPETGSFYKANLHCHTTISDGHKTPAEVKELYRSMGYSIVAFTDHDLMMPHPELNDESFLALPGYEMEVDAPTERWGENKVCHMCFVALTPDVTRQVCWNRERHGYTWGNALRLSHEHAKFDDALPDFVREYSHERISTMMKMGREGGFFVTYNHPAWSMENACDYLGYENMHAMEIYNSGACDTGYDDYNPQAYDDMLRAGKRIYCIAADDNHACRGEAGAGFVMIKADKLDHTLIGKALLAGNFYASQGPRIHSLWVEDGCVHVTCSPAETVTMQTGIIHTGHLCASSGTPITEAVFPYEPRMKYFRIKIKDVHGKYAWSNAYFIDELE